MCSAWEAPPRYFSRVTRSSGGGVGSAGGSTENDPNGTASPDGRGAGSSIHGRLIDGTATGRRRLTGGRQRDSRGAALGDAPNKCPLVQCRIVQVLHAKL